jgi:two-component system OmpR family response regulator
MSSILVVENEVKLAQFMELELQNAGYQVTVVDNGFSCLTTATEIKPDLILLDTMLPEVSGLEICRRLRLTGDRVSIILLTAKEEISDRVAGLDAGADDYILKPFSIEDLLARIKPNLRHTQEPTPDWLQLADLRLNPTTRKVYRSQRLVELTAKEFDLLEYLLTYPGQVLTREQILANVWGDEFMGDSNIIEVYIRYLRLKLEAKGEKRLIKTMRGVGYVLKDS